MATLFSCVAASLQPCTIAPKRSKGISPAVPDVGRVLTVRHLPDTNPDRFLEPAGVLFSSERQLRHPAPPHCPDALDDSWEFASRRKLSPPRVVLSLVLLVLALSLSAGCASSIPPSALPPEVTPELPAHADAGELCRPPDVDAEILQAAWAYVHEHYPMQPWPNDVYLVGDRSAIPSRPVQPLHIVLCSHPTGFVWEGKVVWRLACACCRLQVEEIREVFVAMSTEVTGQSEHH